MRYWLFLILLIVSVSACQPDTTDLPVPTVANIDALATAVVLTENAPPAGFSNVSFPRIDDNLDLLSGWRAELTFEFDGVFSQTTRSANVRTDATIIYNQLGSARRVVAEIVDLDTPDTVTQLEGVRLGPDTFLVRDGTCLTNAGDDANVLADLRAGDVIGGMLRADNTIDRAIINGEAVWRYDFVLEDLTLPALQLDANSRVLDFRREMWLAPEHNAVIRYFVTMEVENARLVQSELPVTGTVIIRYNLYDIGVVPNINVPFGC